MIASEDTPYLPTLGTIVTGVKWPEKAKLPKMLYMASTRANTPGSSKFFKVEHSTAVLTRTVMV